MCSCGTDCVDSAVNQEEIIKSRTPDYETFRDAAGSFTGFLSASPLGTDDLMYAEEPVQQATVWLEPGHAYLYSELTPEQQSIYDQGHRQGREDALNLAQAIATEVGNYSQPDAEPNDVEAALDYLADSMNTNFEAVVGAHNDLAQAVAELGGVFEEHDEVLALNADILQVILDRVSTLEENASFGGCDCGCGGQF